MANAGMHDIRAWTLRWQDTLTQMPMIPPNHYQADRRYSFYVTNANVVIVPDTGNCDDLDGKEVRIFIQYDA